MVVLAFASGASAAAVKVVGLGSPSAAIEYDAAAGESNNLTVSRDASTGNSIFTESTVTVTAGTGCTQLTPHRASCPRTIGTDTLVQDVEISLGDQNDTLHLAGDFGPFSAGDSRGVLAFGGSGDDNLDASSVTVHGVTLNGQDGNDTLRGGAGPDVLLGGAGADVMSGGAGEDRVSYSDHTTAVTATLDGVANDGSTTVDGGTSSGADAIAADVEELEGGSGNDHLVGNGGANVLVGGAGSDRLEGLAGPDFLDANDGIPDMVLCGAGHDKAKVDLKDRPTGFADCETVSQAAVDQHPTVEIRTRSLSVRARGHGRPFVSVGLSCPRALPGGCRGSLAISELAGSGRPAALIGQKRYDIAAGGSGRVAVTITRQAANAAHRHGQIEVRVDAQGTDENGMPKHSLTTAELTG